MIARTLALLGVASCVQAAPFVSSVPTTSAIVASPTEPPITVTVRAPKGSPYRSEILGSKPENVSVEITNDGDTPRDISDLRVGFSAHRGAVPFRCAPADSVPPREPKHIAPHATATFERQLCSLPLPGKYVIDVTAAAGETTRTASFDYVVVAREKEAPRALDAHPNVYGALGGDLAGVRFTRPEWDAGAYHVVVRLTNASMVAVPLGETDVNFRVTKLRQPFACTDTKRVTLPAHLLPGESAIAKVPVTCLLDVEGKYEIHALVGDVELGEIRVDVTSDPHLYLPIWPW